MVTNGQRNGVAFGGIAGDATGDRNGLTRFGFVDGVVVSHRVNADRGTGFGIDAVVAGVISTKFVTGFIGASDVGADGVIGGQHLTVHVDAVGEVFTHGAFVTLVTDGQGNGVTFGGIT